MSTNVGSLRGGGVAGGVSTAFVDGFGARSASTHGHVGEYSICF